MDHTQVQHGIVTKKLPMKKASVILVCLVCCLIFNIAAADDNALLDEWLTKQVAIKTWVADVVQTRKIKSLLRPLESKGQVWFVQPNQFRWQLGDPPRTIAVRTQQELLIVYPKLKQLERYPFEKIENPAMQQALALLEVGFPSDPERFHARYELLSITTTDNVRRFELQPKDKQARRLLAKVRLEVSPGDLTLLATELEFPDGSTMRNSFSSHSLNVEIDASLFKVDTAGYQVAEPLQGGGQ